MKVVIPAAGLGTRFLPATKSMPKEMLPVLDRPVIQYVVEEAVAAGADDITIITGLLKRAVEDHFDHNPELGSANPHPALRHLDALAEQVTIHFVRQRNPRGLGDAVLRAERHVGNEPFGVLLGDSIHVCTPPLLTQLRQVFDRCGGRSSVVALERVDDSRLGDYGIVGGEEAADGLVTIDRLVEKPSIAEAPSHNAITGAYFFTPGIFDALRATAPDAKGEVQLTAALGRLCASEKVYGWRFRGRRYDTGTPALWMEANLRFAWTDPAFRRRVRDVVAELQSTSPGD